MTSGVDVDALTRSQPQSIEEEMDQDIIDEQDQPVNELDLDQTLASTSGQAVSAFGKGLMSVEPTVQAPVKRSLQYMIQNQKEFDPMLAMRGDYGVELQNYHRPKHTQHTCLLYTSPSPRDRTRSRMPSSA